MPRDNAQNRRAFALHEFKALDDAQGTFSGYLACFNNEDLGGDVIEQGAFAKTLQEARERKATRNSNYLFPILYQHDDKQPCGGFVEAHEDSHGLYVKGQLDLDTTLGRETYSGLKKGYLSGMSIGYSTTKQKWQGDVRHLQELALFEGSIVTFPMNPEAQVSAVKAATDDDKAAQEARSKKYGIGIKDGGSVTKPGKWDSLSDADFGDPVNYSYPMPDKEHADNAAARFATPDGMDVYSAKEQDIVAKRIMAKQKSFGEKPDWWPLKDDSGKSADAPADGVKALDFATAYQQVSADDSLQDDWGDSFQALVNALYSVMCQGVYGAGMDASFDAQSAAEDVLAQFSDHMAGLVKQSIAAQFCPTLDDDGDSFYDPDGPNADDGDSYGTMSATIAADVKAFRSRKHEGKAGRTVSADNHAMMSKALDMIGEGHKALSAFVKANDPNAANPGDEPPAQSDSVYDPGFGKAYRQSPLYHYAHNRAANRPRAGVRADRSQATTPQPGAGVMSGKAAQATTHDGDTDGTNDDVAQFRAFMASVRQSVKERAPVAG